MVDFIRSPVLRSASTNRFQPLWLSMWQVIAAEVKSTDNIKAVTFALTLNSADFCTKDVPPAPRGQGKMGGNAHSSRVDFGLRGGGFQHPSSGHTNALTISNNHICEIANSSIESAIGKINISEKHARFFDKVGHGGNKHVSLF